MGMRGAVALLPLAFLLAEPAGAGPGDVSLPGAEPFPPALRTRLAERRAALGASHEPRTRHRGPDGAPRYTNRLLLETSPYLLQHAHNPVDWYPWGDAAFEAAVRLGRPVLLSIGYSTCHWCHVMEEESFDDEEIARFLNEHYVAIKVDREERPDVDAVYTSAVQILTRGAAGWPLNVWLTPDRRPFFGGTYFPPRDGGRGIRTGFLTLLERFSSAYGTRPEELMDRSERLAAAVRESLAPDGEDDAPPGSRALKGAYGYYRSRYDARNGGLDGAPKFPGQLPVRLLLRHYRRTGEEDALRMVEHTLERMEAGGLYDQLGGGFHRYTTDARWQVPHFEKMLYDNALLVTSYLEGYQATGRESFARVVREVLRYVAREMTSPEGAFYAATDADSPGPDGGLEEGAFYTWTTGELQAALGPDVARLATTFYGVGEAGEVDGRDVLHRAASVSEVAGELGLADSQVRTAIEEARVTLYEARAARPRPFRDERILTAWNGLMISAYARAALALGEPAYADRAARAARFLLQNRREDGRLSRTGGEGWARHAAYLEDYAFLAAGLLDLYEATGEAGWLREAVALDAVLERLYEDPAGGFFRTSHDHEDLLVREKPRYDGAVPSGNSVHALNLLRLHELTGDDRYRRRAEGVFRACAARLAEFPAALAELLLAADFALGPSREVVIVTPRSRSEAEPFLDRLRAVFLPNRVLVVAVEGPDIAEQARLVPLLEGKRARGGTATAYVCERGVCQAPTTDPEAFARQIARSDRPGGGAR